MKEKEVEVIKCFGCGALVDNIPGTPHKYIGATQGCWNLFGQILVKEFGEYSYPQLTNRLTVDTYAIQHPGQPGRQANQSVNVHLISLYLIFIRGLSADVATKKMEELISKIKKFDWLEPPVPNGYKTILDVLAAHNQEEHEKKVREWAEDVWNCWYLKHGEKIRQMADNYLLKVKGKSGHS
ncbi:MAG TPA: DUF5946 family protein [Chryseolinea sp.]